MIKRIIRVLLPKSILLFYHRVLAVLANIVYRFPSRKMVVIGVTGTKGKSSTVVMITRILEEAGYKVGSANTIFFKIADKEWPNDTKQGMPGRFQLQRLLRQMVKTGCTHAVIEVTSEGIVQSRHWGIAFDVVALTNLSPEHIEAHGSYEKYREAKAEIFENLQRSYRKILSSRNHPSEPPLHPSLERRGQRGGRPLAKEGTVNKVVIVNGAEPEADYFLQFAADEKYKVADQGEIINLQIPGEFMRTNALLALAVGRALGVKTEIGIRALEKISQISGRAQIIDEGQAFTVMIDYAHEPRSFEAILRLGRELAARKLMAVFGATGGGRDKAKRPILGRLASQYADYVILTTDDPYDDDPNEIINEIASGLDKSWTEGEKWWRIADRRAAIAKAIALAAPGDVVLLLSKGSETVMAVAGGKKIPWNDEEAVREILKKISN